MYKCANRVRYSSLKCIRVRITDNAVERGGDEEEEDGESRFELNFAIYDRGRRKTGHIWQKNRRVSCGMHNAARVSRLPVKFKLPRRSYCHSFGGSVVYDVS